MKKKVLRVTVRGGHLRAVYDDRLAGLIARLGGARSGDDSRGTDGRRGAGPSSPDDDSRLGPPRTIHRGPSEAQRVPGEWKCKRENSISVELRKKDPATSVDAHASKPPCICGSSGDPGHEELHSENSRHASTDVGCQTRCHCGTLFHWKQVSRSAPPLSITRASQVEPGPEGGWTADMGPVGGPVLGAFPRRADALEAEQAWLRQELGL